MPKIINRADAEALIRQQVAETIFQDAPKQSVFMSLARKLPNMTSNQTRIRVLDVLPVVDWVGGDTGRKSTTKQAWANVFIEAEELAVIVPIPEAVLDDAEYNILDEVLPRINEGIGLAVDEAVIFGVNKPAGFRLDIVSTARAAGNNVSDGELFSKLFETDGVWDKVESGGFAVNGAIAKPGFRAKLRGIKTEAGTPLFNPSLQAPNQYTLDGVPVSFPANGGFAINIAQLVAGDWSQAVYAIRQDITVKILTEGIIQDGMGEIAYNLAQQDMIALRVVFRMGWQLPNPATRLDGDRITCPFAYLEPGTPVTVQTVTVNVKDGSSANVKNAYVEIDGARKKTGSDGNAIFTLVAGDYKVKASKKGYTTLNDTITVASSSVSKNLAFAETLA